MIGKWPVFLENDNDDDDDDDDDDDHDDDDNNNNNSKYQPMVGPHKTFLYYLWITTTTHLYTSKGENGTTNATDLC